MTKHYQLDPHPALRDYVKCFWASERHFAPPRQWFDILPDSYIELVFTFGAPCFIEHVGVVQTLPRCVVIGLLDQPLRLVANGVVQVVAARFFAWGFAPLLAGAPNLPSPYAQADADLQALGAALEAALANSLEGAVATLQSHFLARVAMLPEEGVRTAARQLVERNGRLSGEGLAEAAHYSRRQAERKFGQSAGTSPKALTQRLRFEQARDALARDPAVNLATLALECGYADQPHLAREFKRFSAKTPRAFAREMAELRGWMREALDVVFLQDDAHPLRYAETTDSASERGEP